MLHAGAILSMQCVAAGSVCSVQLATSLACTPLLCCMESGSQDKMIWHSMAAGESIAGSPFLAIFAKHTKQSRRWEHGKRRCNAPSICANVVQQPQSTTSVQHAAKPIWFSLFQHRAFLDGAVGVHSFTRPLWPFAGSSPAPGQFLKAEKQSR